MRTDRIGRVTAALALALLVSAGPGAARAEAAPAPVGADGPDLAAVRRDTEWLAGFSTRVVGTEAHDRAVAALGERLRAVGGVRVWTHPFTVTVPRTEEAYLEVAGGPHAGRHPVHPLWPAAVRLNTTPAEGLAGRLVYVGKGGLDDIPAESLRGQIAVMESTGGGAWKHVVEYGPSAVLLLGSEAETAEDFRSHRVWIPINMPRAYVSDGPLAAALRAGAVPEGRLTVRARWAKVEAVNHYVLIPPAGGPDGRKALGLAVAVDAMSLVPDQAPGADAALDAAFALELVRQLAAAPPPRPVFVTFLDGFAIDQRGSREMLAALAVLPWDRADDVQEDEGYAAEYGELEARAAELEASGDPLAGLYEVRTLHSYVRDEVDREIVAIETDLRPKRLAAFEATGPAKAALQEEIAELDRRRRAFRDAQLQLVTETPVTAEREPLARALWGRVRGVIRRQYEEAQGRLALHSRRNELRLAVAEALGLAAPEGARPVGFLLGLDLSDGGPAVGPVPYCRHLALRETRNARSFMRWLETLRRDEADRLWPGALGPVVELEPTRTLESGDAFVPGRIGTVTSPAESFGQRALTWGALDAIKWRLDTPQDRADRLDWARLGPQARATWVLVGRLVRATDFAFEPPPTPKYKRMRARVVDQAPGQPVARLAMEGYLAVLAPGHIQGPRFLPTYPAKTLGLRRWEAVRTGADGAAYFDLLPERFGTHKNERDQHTKRLLLAYQMAEDGRLIRAIDLLRVERGTTLALNPSDRNPTPLRGVVFTCTETALSGLRDPRFLAALRRGQMLDARSGSPPRRIQLALYEGQMAALTEHGLHWTLILQVAAGRNSTSFLNTLDPAAHPSVSTRGLMPGFPAGGGLPRHPAHQAARDLYRLDRRRLSTYARAGVTSEAIDALHARTGGLLEEAEAAGRADDGRALYAAASGALSNEIRAYQSVRDMANDVIRGAILLLLALVPFSFAMERLLIATPHIYRQIAGMLLIFAVMTALLWSFHPAFRISGQPLMIVMAFAIIFMSLLVLSVVYGKFEVGLEEARTGRAEASGARTSRFGVLVTALRLGIANMRKRKLRTGLTGLTVVLVTFALLCFVSSSSYVGRRRRTLDTPAPYTGVLVRQPGRRKLEGAADRLLEAALDAGRPQAVRAWWTRPNKSDWRVHVRNPATGRQVSLLAGLGLAPEEDAITGVGRWLPNWDRFAELADRLPHTAGCYLAESVGEALGVGPGDTVVAAGRPLEVVGLFDAGRFDREAKDLDGEPLAPVDYSALGEEMRQQLAKQDVSLLESELQGLEPEVPLPPVPGNQLLVAPAELLRPLKYTTVRSIVVGAADGEDAHAVADALAERLAFPIYFGSPEAGAGVVVTTPLLPQAPKSLLIPLVIAGLIIFNTMLSSIAERKKEIYIYTSLGLAPLHVGALFLAEAATYGLMGAVFGYVVGQGVATALASLGWLGGITLNYSGTQAVAVMLMVLGIVVLSSLVPAVLAGRLAVPSNRMTWRVPRPEDGRIRDTLPFTVTGQTAGGVLAFLLEYLDAHREGSIGSFTAAHARPLPPEAGALGLEATLWLAPYDLGVRQTLRLVIRPTEDEAVYEIDVDLTRESGQERSWWKLNRVFLGDLRRQLLGWRQLKMERVLDYIRDAKDLMGPAPAA